MVAGDVVEREERQVGAGLALTVGVEEVIDVDGVLVHGLLDDAHAEQAGIEVDVRLGVTCHGADVMDAGEAGRELGAVHG